ncbi:hypothetical protein HAX54_023606 [Datura stramonium]|uniref:Putative plant transposon protein domain-containing protein n=1 Tax=Datura stramonium TaxID=4076 RepID=A0ABS8UX96_DATST|nr:hypothetical protein [Datura stramonium]
MGSVGSKQEDKKWFKEHKESKYSHDKFIDRKILVYVFPHMVDRLHTLVLDFVFDAPGDCNLNMVMAFLANLEPKERTNQVKIRGQIINFSPISLNRLLGTPNVDPQPFVNIVKEPPYKYIRHTLCGPNSVARWSRHQQFEYHVSFSYAHMSREARVWLKIVCACLVFAKHVNHMTRERGIDVTKTKEPEGVNSPVLSVNEHNAQIDNMLSHLVGPGFEESIDYDMATEDEMARVES